MKKTEKLSTDERENFRKEFEMQLYTARWRKMYDLYEKAYRDMQEAKLFLINMKWYPGLLLIWMNILKIVLLI